MSGSLGSKVTVAPFPSAARPGDLTASGTQPVEVPSRVTAHDAAATPGRAFRRHPSGGSGDEPSSRLQGRLVHRLDLDASCRETMFTLLSAHFDGVGRDTFEADLAGKDHIILLEDEGGTLQGFSTLQVYESCVTSPAVTVVYSGDTIVRREAWGSPALPRTWVHAVGELTGLRRRAADVYWLLLTSGYRTYRFLPVFYRWFYPRCDEPTPPAVQRLMDALALERFGTAYRPSEAVVRFRRPQVLKPDLLEVPDGRRRDQHVAFFLAANPGFVRGDELVCVTRMDEDNLTPAARRMIRNR